jgi:hypothetical protein
MHEIFYILRLDHIRSDKKNIESKLSEEKESQLLRQHDSVNTYAIAIYQTKL